jgi:hypothetical protein
MPPSSPRAGFWGYGICQSSFGLSGASAPSPSRRARSEDTLEAEAWGGEVRGHAGTAVSDGPSVVCVGVPTGDLNHSIHGRGITLSIGDQPDGTITMPVLPPDTDLLTPSSRLSC